MKNKLSDLNNILFMQLERLNNEQLSNDEIKMEIERGKGINAIAANIIQNGRLVLDAQIAKSDYVLDNLIPDRLLSN